MRTAASQTDDGPRSEVTDSLFVDSGPLFGDRRAGGRMLAAELECERGPALVVVGLARGGVVVAAEVAAILGAPLDVVAVRKVGHPLQAEYAIGAVTPGRGVYLRGADGMTDEQVAAAVDEARSEAAQLDARLHAEQPPLGLAGRNVLLVDDGVATGATMIAAVRWARAFRAARVVAAAPVGAAPTLKPLQREADRVVCPHWLDPFWAVGLWYESFDQVGDAEVVELMRHAHCSSSAASSSAAAV